MEIRRTDGAAAAPVPRQAPPVVESAPAEPVDAWSRLGELQPTPVSSFVRAAVGLPGLDAAPVHEPAEVLQEAPAAAPETAAAAEVIPQAPEASQPVELLADAAPAPAPAASEPLDPWSRMVHLQPTAVGPHVRSQTGMTETPELFLAEQAEAYREAAAPAAPAAPPAAAAPVAPVAPAAPPAAAAPVAAPAPAAPARPRKEPISDDMRQMIDDMERVGALPAAADQVAAPPSRAEARPPAREEARAEFAETPAVRRRKEPVSEDMRQMLEDLERAGALPPEPEVVAPQARPTPPSSESSARPRKEPISDDMRAMVEAIDAANSRDAAQPASPAPRPPAAAPPAQPVSAAPASPTSSAPSRPAAEPAPPAAPPAPAEAPVDPWSRLIYMKPEPVGPHVRRQTGMPQVEDSYALLDGAAPPSGGQPVPPPAGGPTPPPLPPPAAGPTPPPLPPEAGDPPPIPPQMGSPTQPPPQAPGFDPAAGAWVDPSQNAWVDPGAAWTEPGFGAWTQPPQTGVAGTPYGAYDPYAQQPPYAQPAGYAPYGSQTGYGPYGATNNFFVPPVGPWNMPWPAMMMTPWMMPPIMPFMNPFMFMYPMASLFCMPIMPCLGFPMMCGGWGWGW